MSEQPGGLRFRRALTSGLLVSACAALCAVWAGAKPRPPNLVVIMADDLGAGELGSYGHPLHRTPHLDALAEGGVRFRTAWATPLCSPSRVEILTGRYGFRTGFTNYMGRETTRVDHLDPAELTFADVLAGAGYATGLAGKWQLGRIREQPTMIHDSGFDEYLVWAWMQLPAGARFDGRPWKRRYWHPALLRDGEHRPTSRDDYGPDMFADWLIEFMRRQADRPFLAYYPMVLVHRPWEAPPDPERPEGRGEATLRANVEYMDAIVGRIVAALDELGLRENTIILFTADNGTAGADKGRVSQAGVHVPLIVNGPGVRAGVVSDALVDLSDVLPTLAELAGAPLPAGPALDGRSFAPILDGRAEATREWIFSYLAYERMIRDERWLLAGDGRLFDCRDAAGDGCVDASASREREALAARERLLAILDDLPAPAK